MGRIKLNELEDPDKLLVILGPTASGKTDLAIRLAEIYDCEIISADSRQIYKFMDIGTAKPDKSILSSIPHYFIDILYPNEYFSAGEFADQSKQAIEKIKSKNRIPIIVGGTGLYIKALCEGLFNYSADEHNPEIRNSLEIELEKIGKEAFYEKLRAIDPLSADKYSDKNPRRVLRALEFYMKTGKLLSEAQKEFPANRPYNCFYIGIDIGREELYERINARCKYMWENGLIEETSNLLEMGYSKSLNSMNTIGYKEAIQYLEGELDSNAALELMQKNTRNFAKRQLTWFKKNQKINWLNKNLLININYFHNLYKNV